MAKARQYFFVHDGIEVGPVSAKQLRAFAAEGKLLPDDRVREEGSSKSIRAVKIQGLFPEPPSAPPVQEAARESTPPTQNSRSASREPRTFDRTGAPFSQESANPSPGAETSAAGSMSPATPSSSPHGQAAIIETVKREVKGVALDTWSQSVAISRFARGWWNGQAIKERAKESQRELGSELCRLGHGDSGTLRAMGDLRGRINDPQTPRADAEAARRELAQLELQVAEPVLNRSHPPAEVEQPWRTARELRAQVAARDQELQSARHALLPPDRRTQLRVVAGYAVVAIVVYFGYSRMFRRDVYTIAGMESIKEQMEFYRQQAAPTAPYEQKESREQEERRKKAMQFVTEGKKFLADGNPHTALSRYQQAIEADSNCADAHVALAGAYLALEQKTRVPKIDEAQKALNRAIYLERANKPQAAKLNVLLAQILLEHQKTSAAVAAFREAIKLDRESAKYRYDCGLALMALEKYADAVEQFDAAIEFLSLADKSGEPIKVALYQLAIANQKLKRYDLAIDACKRLLKMAPSSADALNVITLCQLGKGAHDEAIATLAQYSQLAPKDTELHGDVIRELEKARKYDLAVNIFQQLHEKEPRKTEWLHRRSYNLMKLDRLDDALADCEAALTLTAAGEPGYADRLESLRNMIKQIKTSGLSYAKFMEQREIERMAASFRASQPSFSSGGNADRLAAAAMAQAAQARADAQQRFMNQNAGMLGAMGVQMIPRGAIPGR